jgi:hypothetical protein
MTDHPEAPRLTAERDADLRAMHFPAEDDEQYCDEDCEKWPCLITRLLDDRDQWRQRAEALEAAARDLLSRSPFFVTINHGICQFCLENGRHNTWCEWSALTQALAAPAPPPCPGYVPIGHVCERCGQSPQDHSASPPAATEESRCEQVA